MLWVVVGLESGEAECAYCVLTVLTHAMSWAEADGRVLADAQNSGAMPVVIGRWYLVRPGVTFFPMLGTPD
eukprot:1597170-Alexandrium_andersonii.AAC.1